MRSYSEQVEDIEHYNASIEGEFECYNELSQAYELVLWNFGKLNSTEQVLEMTLMLKWTISNISNGFNEISVH